MKNQSDRTFTILADSAPVTGYARARLIGTERPMLLRMDDPAEFDEALCRDEK